jgi:4-amino-4-deoxy-L-arabinose transferase-like glycosyltransferase
VPSRFATTIFLTVLLAASFLLKLNHLGHASIKALDESFHALVAKNLLKHPFTPTLFDKPYVEYDYREWRANHVWLHKPIVPLWQMALSMALLGATPLAMRLPSAILSTGAVWLTYAIGYELFGKDRRPALIAATLQALNPAIVGLVHGYVFSDHIDIALLFWVELSIWCLVRAVTRGGSIGWTIGAGVAQGIAFLSKTYPAFIVTGIALVAALMPIAGFAKASASQATRLNGRAPRRFAWKNVLILLSATLVTIAPWTISCMIRFPREFWFEQAQVFRHLGANVESFAAPWDRLVFDFLLSVYQALYPAVIVATVVLIPRLVRTRDVGLLLTYAWGFGVLVPHMLATSKTPSATLIGWPAFLLVLSGMIVRGIDGDVVCLVGWLVAAMLAVILPGTIPPSGFGYPDPPRFAAVLRQNIWVVWHALVGIAVALGAGWAFRGSLPRRGRVVVIVIASLATILLTARVTRLGWQVTERNRSTPSFYQLAAFVEANLPPDAVLLMEPRQKEEHIIAMFFVDRTIYTVGPETIPQMARQVREGGGRPYLLSNRSLPLPALSDRFLDELRIYTLPESALQQSR